MRCRKSLTIEQKFSKKAHSYNSKALLQKYCAKKLVDHWIGNSQQLVEGPILEIGCGTGFVTREIATLFPKRHYLITDISQSMVSNCRKQIDAYSIPTEKLSFRVLDGEQFEETDKYALIVSGMAFQWFTNFENSLRRLLQGLKPGGVLLFSIPTSNSFPEWRHVCQKLQIPFTANPLPEIDLLEKFSQESIEAIVWKEPYEVHHSTALHFFQNLKEIGASTPISGEQIKPIKMKKLIRYWDSFSSSSTYQIAYCSFKKKG